MNGKFIITSCRSTKWRIQVIHDGADEWTCQYRIVRYKYNILERLKHLIETADESYNFADLYEDIGMEIVQTCSCALEKHIVTLIDGAINMWRCDKCHILTATPGIVCNANLEIDHRHEIEDLLRDANPGFVTSASALLGWRSHIVTEQKCDGTTFTKCEVKLEDYLDS